MSDSFSDWTSKLAEAYCVENGIRCNRKFTDMELERPRQEVRDAAERLVNIYANAAVKRDQIRRLEGSGHPDHDMTAFGERLRPGR